MKTRYNANPEYKDTRINIQPQKGASYYISEKDRFDIRCKDHIDFQKEDKEKKQKIDEFRLMRIGNEMKTQEKINRLKDHLDDEKKLYSQIERSKKLFKYNLVIMIKIG